MRTMILTVTTLFLAACATSEPTIQQGPDAETTFDGLVAIDNSRFSRAWIDPEVDLKSYNKIILGPAEFEFRAVKNKRSPTSPSVTTSNEREFWIDDKDREKLVDTVTAVFNEELGKSKHFTITDTRAPDALILTGGLLDIVSRVPPELIGRGEIYLASVGEATLVLQLADSLSGETIYRAVDRRRIQRPGREMLEANRVTTWAEVRRWARQWARQLVDGLDWIHE